MQHSVHKLLLDLKLACEEIGGFCENTGFEEFLENRMLQLAMEREFEIIGEALNRLEKIDPDGIERNIPECRKIIGFRNVIAHGYDIIDDAALWDFAINHVPDLLRKVKRFE